MQNLFFKKGKQTKISSGSAQFLSALRMMPLLMKCTSQFLWFIFPSVNVKIVHVSMVLNPALGLVSVSCKEHTETALTNHAK